MDAADGVVKGEGNEATVDGAVSHSEQREGAREGERGVRGWDCQCEWGGFREWHRKVLGAEAAKECEPIGKGGSGEAVGCGESRSDGEGLDAG